MTPFASDCTPRILKMLGTNAIDRDRKVRRSLSRQQFNKQNGMPGRRIE
jgi:hypothetical protein